MYTIATQMITVHKYNATPISRIQSPECESSLLYYPSLTHAHMRAHTHTHTHRAKHPVKVHVWVGISLRGRTGICIFDSVMEATVYNKILDQMFVHFIKDVYPVHTSLWRIMIPSIPLGMHSSILRRKGSIGGVPLLNHRILIQLKICGTS